MQNGIVQLRPGRPQLTAIELETLLLRLTPYLHRGLTIKNACLQTGIPASTVYKKMQEVEWFKNSIERAQQFFLVAYSDVIFREFMRIYAKVLNQIEMTNEELKFLCWLGENDRRLSEYFGKHNWRIWMEADRRERIEMQQLEGKRTFNNDSLEEILRMLDITHIG